MTPPTASSGLPVVLSVLSGPATITNNLVTITGAGNVTLAADQAGNSNYSAAKEVTASFTVEQATQTIGSFTTIPNQSNLNPVNVTPPTASSGLPVTLSVQMCIRDRRGGHTQMNIGGLLCHSKGEILVEVDRRGCLEGVTHGCLVIFTEGYCSMNTLLKYR